ncbi:MAG: chalcone isomerase [Lentisphaerae bacterium]|jgi:hypothetical protein|nr:chalcone isomerase [Lentisphaerota bacterium]
MKPRQLLITLLLLAALAGAVQAADLVANGSGLRTKPLLGALYELELRVPPALQGADAKALIEADEPMQMVLTLKSGLITRKRFVETTTDGFAKAARSGYQAAETGAFLAQFDNTEFRKGDIVLMTYGPDGLATVYRQLDAEGGGTDTSLATIPGLELKKALFAIWLGDTPAQASLKNALLGGK